MPEAQGGGTPPQGSGGTPGQGGSSSGVGETPTNQTQPVTFDTWLAGQDDTVKGLLAQHTQGLKSALDTERTQRQDLSKQLKDFQGKAEKGSDTEKLLVEVQNKLEQSERRATFNEEAATPAVGCLNAKAAYALAVAEQLFDRKGNPDWAALKAAAPELFRKPNGSVDGGMVGNAVNAHGDMNAIIRRAAGRG